MTDITMDEQGFFHEKTPEYEHPDHWSNAGAAPAATAAPTAEVAPEGPEIIDFENLSGPELRELHLKRDPGQAPVKAGYRTQGRSGAVGEREGAPERRDEIHEERKDIIREQGDLERQDIELGKAHLDEQIAETQRRTQEKQGELAEVEERYREERSQLDESMATQRELLEQGVGMERVMNTTSGQFGAMMSSLSLAVAGFGGANVMRNAMDMYDRSVKNILATQEMEGQMAQRDVTNSLNKLNQTYGDRNQARSAMEIMLADAALQELQKLKMQNADPRAKLAVDEVINEVEMKKEMLEEDFHERSTGKVSESYQQEVQGRAGGTIIPMNEKEIVEFEKNKASYMSSQASMMKSTADIQKHEQAMMQKIDDMPEAWSDWKVENRELAKFDSILFMQDELAKMRGQRLDYETGEFLGEWGNIPGRGVADYVFKGQNLIGDYSLDRKYSRTMKMLVQNVRLAITGQAAANAELSRIEKMLDSPLEFHHKEALNALNTMTMTQIRARERNLPRDVLAYRTMRGREIADAPASPGSFGDTER